jgi:hypothetical protein
MKASDIIYNSSAFPNTRGELIEFLCNCIENSCDPEPSDRLSNGFVTDTLLSCADRLIITDNQLTKLREFLSEVEKIKQE